MIKKILLILSVITSISSVLAETPEGITVVPEGIFHFQAGFLKQNHLEEREKYLSGNKKGFALYSEAALGMTISNTINDLTYGGKIALLTTAKQKTSASYNGSHIFIESEYGRLEIGSPHDADSKMRITADDISAATGGDWSRYAKLDSTYLSYNDMAPEFVPYKEYFFDAVFKTSLKQINDGAEPSRKISYYSPKVNGLQLGLSYIPDSGNTGGGAQNISTTNADPINGSGVVIERSRDVVDAVGGGIAYEHNITDGTDIKIALTGEYGKIVKASKITITDPLTGASVVTNFRLRNLKTYNVGAILTQGNFSYAISYGDLLGSLTNKQINKTGTKTRYYNGVVAYGQGPVKASVSFFKSDHFKNSINAITLGTEYKFLPGLTPYVEVALFTAKGKPSFYPEASTKKTRGTVALIGSRLKL